MNNDDFATILYNAASGHEAYQYHVIVSKQDLRTAARIIQEITIELRKLCYDVLNDEDASKLHDRARMSLEKI